MPVEKESGWAKEPHIQAFAWRDAHASSLPAPPAGFAPAQPLHLQGLTFGVKDVIDVKGMPTQYGCAGIPTHVCDWDASVVAQLRAAGAQPVGKTVTAEFAYVTPGPTRNPWNFAHTPGGSSSGSAAAVAAGMVDFAVGTQTGGSIIRPAAFCGVVGLKPSFGLVHRQGMLVTAETLDTIGWFTQDLHTCAQVLSVITQQAPATPRPPARIAWANVDANSLTPQMQQLMAVVGQALRAQDIPLQDMAAQQPMLDQLTQLHGLTVRYEIARGMQAIAAQHHQLLSTALQDAIREGAHITSSSYLAAQHQRAALASAWLQAVGDADVIIAPSTLGAAPLGLQSTGSSVPNRPWSMLGWPCLHLPMVFNPQGLPLGVQLIAKPWADTDLLAMAHAIQDWCLRPAHWAGSVFRLSV